MKFIILGMSLSILSHCHSESLPTETGQSQFASIAEITQILIEDQNTDWNKVSIDKLHAHLLDMNKVTLETYSKTSVSQANVTFLINGRADAIAATLRMTQAHATMLGPNNGWTMESTKIEDSVEVLITPANVSDLPKIAALGFYGIMTIGAHHQQHHLAIASGANPHSH